MLGVAYRRAQCRVGWSPRVLRTPLGFDLAAPFAFFGQDGVRLLRTPRRAPQANAYCERLIGITRRECLDFLIPLSEEHLRRLLTEWR